MRQRLQLDGRRDRDIPYHNVPCGKVGNDQLCAVMIKRHRQHRACCQRVNDRAGGGVPYRDIANASDGDLRSVMIERDGLNIASMVYCTDFCAGWRRSRS